MEELDRRFSTAEADAAAALMTAMGDRTLLPSDELQLLGKRIAVTAPRNYALRLAEQLSRCGAKPLIMSTVATEPLADYAMLDGAIKNLVAYDYVTFTSVKRSVMLILSLFALC